MRWLCVMSAQGSDAVGPTKLIRCLLWLFWLEKKSPTTNDVVAAAKQRVETNALRFCLIRSLSRDEWTKKYISTPSIIRCKHTNKRWGDYFFLCFSFCPSCKIDYLVKVLIQQNPLLQDTTCKNQQPGKLGSVATHASSFLIG